VAKRKKKGEPEMLIVSFCDIVTITTAAMFFAMLITVQEAVKIPVLQGTPRMTPTDKQAFFFECRSNEVYSVDLARLQDQVAELLKTITPEQRAGGLESFLRIAQVYAITNQYYRVNLSYLLMGQLALEPRPEALGEPTEQLDLPDGRFQFILSQLDPKTQYVTFLVRDDSFVAFRKARQVADKRGFQVGWELLGADEPIKFGTGGRRVGVM
jgi:hypothetical protein